MDYLEKFGSKLTFPSMETHFPPDGSLDAEKYRYAAARRAIMKRLLDKSILPTVFEVTEMLELIGVYSADYENYVTFGGLQIQDLPGNEVEEAIYRLNVLMGTQEPRSARWNYPDAAKMSENVVALETILEEGLCEELETDIKSIILHHKHNKVISGELFRNLALYTAGGAVIYTAFPYFNKRYTAMTIDQFDQYVLLMKEAIERLNKALAP